MKKTLTKLTSLLLVFALVLSFVPSFSIEAKAAPTWSTNQQNIADWADFFFDTTWVCQKTIMGWRDQYTFYEGETYHLPYGQPVNSGKFIGYGVTLEDFLIAAADVNSVFYSRQSEFNGWTSTYYGCDCASFVAMCWGTVRQDCSTIPYYSTKKGAPTLSNIHSILQLGDCLDSTSVGHVVLVTDMKYDDDGNLIQIEITEQTPPQLKRTVFTPSELADKYAADYSIYRYERTVPAAPVRGYISKCTQYASHSEIEITADTPIMSLPCSAGVDEESALIETAVAKEVYTATRLYENTEGELWYRVQLEDGEEGYIAATGTKYLGQILDDITISGYATPNAHVRGRTFSVTGNIGSRYSGLTTAAVYIYKGFGINGNPVTGGSDVVSSNSYTLVSSSIDYNTSFGDLTLGEHTYAISADYKNYYVADGDIASISGTVNLAEDYFVVISSSVSQSTCGHTNSETVVREADCTTDGIKVTACSRCGLVSETTLDASGHAYDDWTSIGATCTADGSKTRSCGTCGNVENQIIAASGHNYELVTHEANCKEYEIFEFICDACGDSYNFNAGEMASQWSEMIPEGLDASLFETKTEYRYADCISTSWEEISTGKVSYVNSWPSGFDTGNSLYAGYNNKASKITASETETAKTAITSDKVAGYLYYHWCRTGYPYSVSSKQGNYNRFHAFYSTTNPNNYTCDTSDMSYNVTGSTACNDCVWYFTADVYDQSYATYEKVNDGKEWGEWSDWSDTVYSAVDNTRQVETRTVYRLQDAQLAEHNYVDGACTVCGNAAQLAVRDYYLIGYINGAYYGCEDDWENLGEYKFIDGALTATFNEDSHVFVKTGDNANWYMAESYITDTTGTLKNTNLGTSEKMYVPGGVEVTFTLVVNEDGSLTLSYTEAVCNHESHNTNGTCTKCGEIVEHTFADGSCAICGAADPDYVPPVDYYLVGFINGANYGCEEDADNLGEYKFVDGKLTVFFEEDSFVFVKTGDNSKWYMSPAYDTDGYAALYPTSTNTKEKVYVPGGVEVQMTLEKSWDDCLFLNYITIQDCYHEDHDTNGICTNCGESVSHSFAVGACTVCGLPCEHSYTDGVCTRCGDKLPVDYYLFGWINGANYACEEDAANMGEYKFVDGTLTTTFAEDSYVAVKITDNRYWYMCEGYIENVTSRRLFNADGLTKPEKMYVPGGKEVTFTLQVHNDNSVTLSYVITEEICEHPSHDTNGICASCGESVAHSYGADEICTVCGKACLHNWANGVCVDCGKICVHPAHADAGYCTTCGVTVGHNYTATVTAPTCTAPGYTTYTCAGCGDSYMMDPIDPVAHSKENGVVTEPTCTAAGFTTYTCGYCGKVYQSDFVEATGHNFVDGFCTGCGLSESNPEYITIFYNNAATKWEKVYIYSWDDSNKFAGEWPGTEMTLVDSSNDIYSFVLPADAVNVVFNNGSDAQTADLEIPSADSGLNMYSSATGTWTRYTSACDHLDHDTDGICSFCGVTVEHSYGAEGICIVCGVSQAPAVDYYLFGFIDGANYACEQDFENMGTYKFVDGTLTTTFAQDSYVAVKTTDNAAWYMTEGYHEGATKVELYNTANGLYNPNKMFVPGGVEVTFTLAVNDDGSLTLSYVVAEPPVIEDSKDIKWQVTNGTNADSATTNLRLLTWVDSPANYSSVTFNVTINGRTTQLKSTTAYTAILAAGVAIRNPANIFKNDSANYFVTYTLKNIPNSYFGMPIVVTVTWTDLEGNETTSESKTILIANDWA